MPGAASCESQPHPKHSSSLPELCAALTMIQRPGAFLLGRQLKGGQTRPFPRDMPGSLLCASWVLNVQASLVLPFVTWLADSVSCGAAVSHQWVVLTVPRNKSDTAAGKLLIGVITAPAVSKSVQTRPTGTVFSAGKEVGSVSWP